MRAPLRWALVGLLAALALAVPTPALAATPTLTALPAKPLPGQTVTLVYDGHTDPQTCAPAQNQDDQVRFKLSGSVFRTVDLNPNTCRASTTYDVPSGAKCGSTLSFAAVPYYSPQTYEDAALKATAAASVTCPKPTVSPTPLPTISLPASPTASATASPSASPTASATPSVPPSATPSATPTPTATLAPTGSPTPVVAVSAPDFPVPGGGSSAPWLVGGGLLGLVGVGGSLLLLRPRFGTPIAAGVSVVAVAAGAGLALLAPSDPPAPLVTGSYTAGDGEGCARGDIPVNGGFYDLDVPTDLLRFHPAGSSSDVGYWLTSVSGTGHGSTVCLRLGRPVVWRVRDASLPATKPSGAVSCQIPESLLGGGFAFPWGLSGSASHPEAPMRWVAANAPYTAGPAPAASVSALCAELPDGLRTYVTSGSTHGPGEAVARCFPGDAVLNGGYAGSQVQASYPIDGGWLTQTVGGGMSYAVCFHPSRAFGLRATYERNGDGHARCDGKDTVLAGGWESGTDLDGLQHFEPEGAGWQALRPTVGGSTAHVLCARRWGS